MPGSDGLVSCVGGCNSKLFKSRRVHRPLVDSMSQGNINLQAPPRPDEKPDKLAYSRNRYRPVSYYETIPITRSTIYVLVLRITDSYIRSGCTGLRNHLSV